MRVVKSGVAILLVLVGSTASLAQAPSAPQAARVQGFLTAETTPDAFSTIPPAPKEGEPRNDADWAIFRATRILEGSDRWKLAQGDNSYRPADLLADFSCAIGAQLTTENAPTLATILARTTVDAGAAAARAKDVYKRTRPYLHNPGNICIDRSDELSASFDYPSGHTSLSWTAGLVMSELAPDRAAPIMARARAYGESRVVCGVHNWSAVEAGRTNGAGVYAGLHSSAEFMAAVPKARAEVDAARRSGPKPPAAMCASEAELTASLVVN